MASLINPFNINGNFPVAGQDNDSQGFRDNFTNIKNNLYNAKQEIEDLQNKAVLKSSLAGQALNNDFQGSQVKNIQTKNQSETVYDWGQVGNSNSTAQEVQLDLSLGNIHKLVAQGSIKINSVIKNWPGSLQFSRLLFYINISSANYTLELPTTLTTDLAGVGALRQTGTSKTVAFTDPGWYIYEFSSADSGTTIFVRELTKGNFDFKDPQFYFVGAGLYTQPSLRLGWSNLYAVSASIDTAKSGADVFSVRGGITSYMNQADGGNDPSAMTTGGFSVAKSRVVDPGAGIAPSELRISNNDLIGYYNALGYTYNTGGSTSAYRPLAQIAMYANGSSSSGLGGNILISTKADGGNMLPAIGIDSGQNVIVYANLDVRGAVTYIESSIVTVKDKNIILGNGSSTTDTASGAGLQVETALSGASYANIIYLGQTDSGITGGTWNFNKGVNVSVSTASIDTTSGALIVTGGAGIGGAVNIGGALNVGGSFGLTSTTEATTTTAASFSLLGGMATAKNIIAGGNLFANATSTASNLNSGSFQVQGGAMVKGNLYVGGQSGSGPTLGGLYVLAGSASTTNATGAVVVAGGIGVSGNAVLASASSANGVLITSTLNVTSGGQDGNAYKSLNPNNSAYSATAALQVNGGTRMLGNLVLFSTSSSVPAKLFIDNNINPSVVANLSVDFTSGAMNVGNITNTAGITVSGDLFMGTASTGRFMTRYNTQPAIGVNTGGPGIGAGKLLPNQFQVSGTNPILAAINAVGGAQILGNLYVGQPHDGTNWDYTNGTWSGSTNTYGKPVGSMSGNIVVQSGTIAINQNSGAIVIQQVTLADGSTSAGGMGIAGNLWVNGNVNLGSIGGSTGNVIVWSTQNVFNGGVPTANVGAFIVPVGGAYIGGNAWVAGNVVLGSKDTASNVVIGATQNSTSSTTGALVVSGGVGVSGNIYVGGSAQPINAVGASGIAIVNGSNTNSTFVIGVSAIATATLFDITNLNFQAQAGVNYQFEAWIMHDLNVSSTKGFAVTFSTGSCRYLIEQQSTATTSAFTLQAGTASATAATVATGGAVTGIVTKITGTFYSASATNVKLQAQFSGVNPNSMTIYAASFLKWTRLS